MTREPRTRNAAHARLASINEVLQAQLETLTQIESILGNERHALEDRAPEAILAAAEAKAKALGRLSELEDQRKSITVALNDEQLEQLNELTARCRIMNQHNAALLHVQQQHVNRLVGLLRGNQDSRPSSYDATGKTNSGTSAQLRLTQV